MKRSKSSLHSIGTKKGDSIASSFISVSHDDKSSHEFILPSISKSKWQEMQEKEERDLLILQIRNELFDKTMEICYKKYLNRQAIPFTVHCAHLALNDIIDSYCKQRDPGEPRGVSDNPRWKTDQEPASLPTYGWTGESVPIYVDPSESSTSVSSLVANKSCQVSSALFSHKPPSVEQLKLEINNLRSMNSVELDNPIRSREYETSNSITASTVASTSSDESKKTSASLANRIRELSNARPIYERSTRVCSLMPRPDDVGILPAQIVLDLPQDRIPIKYSVYPDTKVVQRKIDSREKPSPYIIMLK